MRRPLTKPVPPRWWAIFLLLTLVPCSIMAWPNIASSHDLRGRLLQNLDKSLFQPPALEETIHEVQQILNQDPSLPRLTRGEIEELYEKVTREEYHKSLEAGDKVRADSMRALMLVLPYNTNNNTEENLQELFTRPPVTKVVDSYSSHQPIQFLTPSAHNEGRFEPVAVGQMDATTYKPSFRMKTQPLAPNPTTYHPSNPPPVLYHMTPSLADGNYVPFKPLVTDLPSNHAYGVERSQTAKPVQRFSSHYSAKDIEFLKQALEKRKYTSSSTIKPVADILESMGIVSQTRNRVGLDDFYAAESAPTPQIVGVADLKGLRSQGLGPKIKPDAYSMFKPLNIGEEIRVKPEVEGYLTRFGIVGGRKRKAIKKNEASSSTQNTLEQYGEESEIATAKVPSGHVKPKKSVQTVGNSELTKLLENLKELERLNQNPKVKPTSKSPPTTTTTSTSTTTTTTTTTTTPAPTTPALITNGQPLLIEPKKPRRRIDPNIDINFGNQGNQQTDANKEDQLSKLLQNLQELENLKVSPGNAQKIVTPAIKANNAAASRPVAIVTAAPTPVESQTLGNRFSQSGLTPQQHLMLLQQQVGRGTTQPDLQQLQQVLQQLQAYEQANARTTKKPTTTSTTTTATTKKPINAGNQLGPTDLWQLRKLLTDDSELEKLFEQAKARQQQSQKPKTTTTSTTTSTTKRPGPTLTDLVELQKYFAELDKAARRTTTTTPLPPTTTPSTTTTTTTPRPTTTTTTTTTTPRPPSTTSYPTLDYDSRPRKQSADQGQLQELINRVQQLERLNNRHAELQKPSATDTPLSPLQGFTTRNVKPSAPQAPVEDLRLPVNDFANLRTLYRQVEQAERVQYGDIEISTKATAAKAYEDQLYDTTTRRSQNFAQRIIDITNDTGTGSSLRQVDANEFVQLQKLLSKVQELERVRITLPTPNPRPKNEREATRAPALESAASQRTQNVQNLNGAHIVYPTKEEVYPTKEDPYAPKESTYKQVEELLLKDEEVEDLKLDLPAYKQTFEKPYVAQSIPKPETSSEELREFVYAKPYVESSTYKDLQPPMIHKTVTKEPPRFVATKGPLDVSKMVTQQKADLAELQKLLNNAQELKKLGITLPKELTEKLETKFDQPETTTKKAPSQQSSNTNEREAALLDDYINSFSMNNNGAVAEGPVFRPPTTTTESPEPQEPTERTAVFSLTTPKSLTPRPPKTTTESSVELPVFSATKIIEAAIKRAANKIGVSTEFPQGFRRRSDDNAEELEFPQGFRRRSDDNVDDLEMMGGDDMMTDFSEINYQLAMPEEEKPVKPVEDLSKDVNELQRLIKNLEELQKLNLSQDSKLLRQADAQYFASLKATQTPADDTFKTRRQSDEDATETTAAVSESTLANPTRVQLNLGLDDDIGEPSSTTEGSTTSTTTTTEEPRNGSLADLEDSFGPDPNTESPPPPKKKNGFYFLADWNSFLEVGDGDDQVVVRLSPKIGDPRLFLPVKIP